MWIELMAVFSASLLGSWHCAAMCGPFGLFLRKTSRPGAARILYHLGRLATYTVLAAVLQILSFHFTGFWGTGVFLALIACWAVFVIAELKVITFTLPKPLAKLLGRSLASGWLGGAFVLGAVTTLLPCVWLYGFLLLAASRPTLARAELLILSFWLGTLPALAAAHFFLARADQGMATWMRKGAAVFALVIAVMSVGLHKNLLSAGKPRSDSAAGESCPLHQEH